MSTTRKLSKQQKRKARERAKRWRENNRGRHRSYSRDWKKKNKTRAAKTSANNHLVRTYGITVEERDALFERQGRACAICGVTDADQWCVDHCHHTGRVRGILCRYCNWGLGSFRDNPLSLASAISYLRTH